MDVRFLRPQIFFVMMAIAERPGVLFSQGPTDWRTLLHNANHLYSTNDAGAEKAYLQAAEHARLLSDGGEALAAVYTNLGGFYVDNGRYPEAEDLLDKALAIRQGNPDTPRGDIATTLKNLASAYRSMSRYSAAEDLLGKAITLVERSPGSDQIALAYLLNSRGELYLELWRWTEAEKAFRRALDIGAGTSASADLHGDSFLGLSVIQAEFGDLEGALTSARRALRLYELSYGPRHYRVGRTLVQIGRIEYALQRFRNSRESLTRALRILEDWRGADHPEVLVAVRDLAELERFEGRFGEAERLAQRVVAAAEQRSDAAPLLGTSLHQLALIYSVEKRYAAAEPLFIRSIAITESVVGASNPELAVCLYHYAEALSAARRVEEAERAMRRAIGVAEQYAGTNSPRMILMLDSYARILRKLSRKQDAKQVEKRALAIRALHPESVASGRTIDITALKAGSSK
jgi:tetratricopeptide (TPR) repeat protein